MEFTAQLDVDVVALEAEDEVTCVMRLARCVGSEIQVGRLTSYAHGRAIMWKAVARRTVGYEWLPAGQAHPDHRYQG